MTSVTGLTAARMMEIEAASVVNGDVVGNDLHLITHGGSTINAGNVRGPMGPAGTGHVICTSTTRPTGLVSGDAGLTIYETDTDEEYVWNGSAWVSARKGLVKVLHEIIRTANSGTITNTESNPGGYERTVDVVAGRIYSAKFGCRCTVSAANTRINFTIAGDSAPASTRYGHAEFTLTNPTWIDFTLPLILPTGSVQLWLTVETITTGETFVMTADTDYPGFYQLCERI